MSGELPGRKPSWSFLVGPFLTPHRRAGDGAEGKSDIFCCERWNRSRSASDVSAPVDVLMGKCVRWRDRLCRPMSLIRGEKVFQDEQLW
jgi:hypothetical protein